MDRDMRLMGIADFSKHIVTFADIQIQDGYSGDTVICEAGIMGDGTIVSVHSHGYYRLLTVSAVDADEALWLLNNHPSARHIKVL